MFLTLGGYSTRFPQCLCKSLPPFSEAVTEFQCILFRFPLLAWCTLICLRRFGRFNTLKSWLRKTPLGNGEKTPQPSIDNHLFFLPFFFWQADLNTNIEDESRSFYGVSSQYESPENMVITCSTKVCSFGKQVVEKVEVGSRYWVQGSLWLLSCHFKYLHLAYISRQNISHACCQGDGCHRLLFLRHTTVRLLQPETWPCLRTSLKVW